MLGNLFSSSWWFSLNPAVIFWLTVGTILYFVLLIILMPLVIAFIPYNYFKLDYKVDKKLSIWNFWWHVIKNGLGFVLLIIGILMLVLPGQGILTILVALMLLDFPKKKQLERWIIQRKPILKTVNHLRLKFRKPPLDL